MGFVCVIKSEETDLTKLKERIWHKAYANDDHTMEPETLVNGCQVVVCPNTVVIETKNGRFVDIITTPGGYLYHKNVPANEKLEQYAQFMQGMVELFIQELGMDSTGLAFIETDCQITSPEDLYAWFMRFMQVQGQYQSVRICSNCGYNVNGCEDMRFCPRCGNVL